MIGSRDSVRILHRRLDHANIMFARQAPWQMYTDTRVMRRRRRCHLSRRFRLLPRGHVSLKIIASRLAMTGLAMSGPGTLYPRGGWDAGATMPKAQLDMISVPFHCTPLWWILIFGPFRRSRAPVVSVNLARQVLLMSAREQEGMRHRKETGKWIAEPNRTEPIMFWKVQIRSEPNRTGSFLIKSDTCTRSLPTPLPALQWGSGRRGPS